MSDAAIRVSPISLIVRSCSHGQIWCKRARDYLLKCFLTLKDRWHSPAHFSQDKGARVRIPFSVEAQPTLEIARKPEEQDVRQVQEAIYVFNRSKAGNQHFEPLTIFLRDSHGKLVGGLLGSTYWKWLTLDFLWVSEDLRGRGYGTQLVMAAEKEAIAKGCRHARLDTFSFQAKAFYEKLGYFDFGVLDDFPSPHKRYFFRKDFFK